MKRSENNFIMTKNIIYRYLLLYFFCAMFRVSFVNDNFAFFTRGIIFYLMRRTFHGDGDFLKNRVELLFVIIEEVSW